MDKIWNYLCVPSDLLVAGLWELPLVLRDLGYCFEFIADFVGKDGLLHLVVKLLAHIHAIDRPAFILVFHQQERVVIRFLSIEIHFLGMIDLEVLIDLLVVMFLLEGLAVYPHFLSERAGTETGSFTRFSLASPFWAIEEYVTKIY